MSILDEDVIPLLTSVALPHNSLSLSLSSDLQSVDALLAVIGSPPDSDEEMALLPNGDAAFEEDEEETGRLSENSTKLVRKLGWQFDRLEDALKDLGFDDSEPSGGNLSSTSSELSQSEGSDDEMDPSDELIQTLTDGYFNRVFQSYTLDSLPCLLIL